MNLITNNIQDIPIALSSYRYPSYHPHLPWDVFLSKCDYNMPQVYWMKADNPGEQLRRSVREFQNMKYHPPILPTGAAFTEWGWVPTTSEVNEFLETAVSLNLKAANFWEWDNCRTKLPEDVWCSIRDFPWETTPQTLDIAEAYIESLNTHSSDEVGELYTPNAVHVTPARTIQGLQAIKDWHVSLFDEVLPQATFTLTGFSGAGNSRHIAWTAQSSHGDVQSGNDTLGLLDGKIAYHFSYFKVTE